MTQELLKSFTSSRLAKSVDYDLEDAYLKIMGANHIEDLLSWRENGPNGEAPKKKEKKKRK